MISGATFSLCFGVFSFGMFMNPDASSLWALGAVAGLAGAAGGVYEVGRYVKEEMHKNDPDPDQDTGQDGAPPAPPQH